MPQLGLTMEEGTVTGWLKKTGDSVRKDEPLLTISTEKAEMEVESLVDGVLGQIVVQAGDVVPVGTVLAYIEGVGEDITVVGSEQRSAETLQAIAPQNRTHESSSTESQAADSTLSPRATERGAVSPRARRLAKELGVDADNVSIGGQIGPISEADIRNAAARQGKASKPAGSNRRLIAERLTRSVQTIPTFLVSAEANAEKLLGFYESVREPIHRSTGVKATVTDLFLRLFAVALRESPTLNAIWIENNVHPMSSVDIGLAVDTPKGVIAPLLRNVDSLDLHSLVAQRAEISEKARRGQLSLNQLEGGATTLSNLGMYRVDSFQAIINPSQSSILAVGQIRKRPWVEDTLVVKPTVMLNLTVDHRVADGAAAAAFLSKIVEKIESSVDSLWAAPQRSSGNGRKRSHA